MDSGYGCAGCLVVVALVAGLGFPAVLIGDMATGRDESFQATVSEKVYTPSSSSVGTGTVFNPSNGSVSTVTTVESESEKYTLIVDAQDNTYSASTSARIYSRTKAGDKVTVKRTVGGWVGIRYGCRVE